MDVCVPLQEVFYGELHTFLTSPAGLRYQGDLVFVTPDGQEAAANDSQAAIFAARSSFSWVDVPETSEQVRLVPAAQRSDEIQLRQNADPQRCPQQPVHVDTVAVSMRPAGNRAVHEEACSGTTEAMSTCGFGACVTEWHRQHTSTFHTAALLPTIALGCCYYTLSCTCH